jgi:hypothetical protein
MTDWQAVSQVLDQETEGVEKPRPATLLKDLLAREAALDDVS